MNKLSNIKLARLRIGLKVTEVAKLLGVSHSYISRVESMDLIPTPERIKQLAKIYNTTEKDLID